MSHGIKLLIFDLDGTLVDAYPAIVDSFNFTMRKMKLPLAKEMTIHRAVGWGDTNLLKPFVPARCVKKALTIYRRHHTKSLRWKTRFLPGAKNLLESLRKMGYRLGVASNRPTKFSHIILEHLRAKGYFDYILCADKIERAKPYPDILFRILKKLSVKPTEAIYVGDMTVDILAGKRAKVKTVAVVSGSSTRKELRALKPYRMIQNIAQLPRILKEVNGKVTLE